MAEAYSLLEFLQQLSLDDGLRAAFTADPRATLAGHGLAGLTAEDVRDAAVLVEDTRTAEFNLGHELAPDPAAGFLDAFLPGEPTYLPSDLGESVDPPDLLGDVPEHVAGFGTGHATVPQDYDHLAPDAFSTEHHAATHHTAVFDGYGEHYTDLDEHRDPDLDDLFVDHPDPASGTEHHAEPPAH